MNTGGKKNLIGIDVADSRNAGLFQQTLLDRFPASGKQPLQICGSQPRVIRLNPQTVHTGNGIRLSRSGQPETSETARIRKPQLPPVVKRNDHMRMFHNRVLRRLNQQGAGHTEMYGQSPEVPQAEQQKFAAPIHSLERSADHSVAELLRTGKGENLRTNGDQTGDPLSAQLGSQHAPHRLDFRQLRHQ